MDQKENRRPAEHASKKRTTDSGWLNARRTRKDYKIAKDFLLEDVPQKGKGSASHGGVKRPRSTTSDQDPVLLPLEDKIFQASIARPSKVKKYCCPDCEKWFADDPLYASKEDHLRITGRHKSPPFPATPPRMWDIGFPDSDEEQQ